MTERPVELAIPGTILIPVLTDMVMGFLGDTNVSRRYGGTRTLYRFYVFEVPRVPLFARHVAVEAWEWWEAWEWLIRTPATDVDAEAWFRFEDRRETGGLINPLVPHAGGWRCYMCNVGHKALQWKMVFYAEIYLHRYFRFLPILHCVKKRLFENMRFMNRWICSDCVFLFRWEDTWTLPPVQ